MKRIVIFTSVLLACLLMFTSCKWTKTPEGVYVTTNGDGTGYVSGIDNSTDAELVIPSTSPKGDSITSIGEKAAYSCEMLKSVVIPDSVKSIQAEAFYRCKNLTSVTIGNGVLTIAANAFMFCSGLKTLDLGDSVTDIGANAFSNCEKLTSVVIPNSVTSMGDNAFSHCGLTSVVIPGSVESVGNGVFYGCDSLSKVEIGMANVDDGLLSGCTSVTSITLKNGVTTIGDQAFSDCYFLETVYIPKSVVSIGDAAFANLKTIYYAGSEREWDEIAKGNAWDANLDPKSDYTIHFNSFS